MKSLVVITVQGFLLGLLISRANLTMKYFAYWYFIVGNPILTNCLLLDENGGLI